MSGVLSRRTSRALRWGVVIAAAVVLLACVPAAFAAPKTTHAAAYGLMKNYMQQYDKDGFAKVVDLGGVVAYRKKLASLKLVVDPKLGPIAKYDPNTDTLTLSQDPRKVTAAGSDALGETVWHEVTHAFEDQHGDTGLLDPEPYRERNVDYMMSVARTALLQLEVMERHAKDGASVEHLRANWQNYLKQTEAAAKLNPEYPPDLALMRTWFGFRANPEEVKTLYLTGKAFSGKKWANLREALTPALSWAGTWDCPTMALITLTQTGAFVTGAWTAADYSECTLEGILSADGMTLTGSMSYPETSYSFSITMQPDWWAWEGTMWSAGWSGNIVATRESF